MKTIGFIGNFEVPYSTENDRKWSLEKLGHTVIPFQENTTNNYDLFSAMGELDLLIYSHTHGWDIHLLEAIFATYKDFGVPTASVHLDRWAWLDREKDIGTEATWFTEYQFMADGSPEAVELYKKHNLNWHWLKPGVVERDCYMAEPDRERFPHEIIFVGSKGYHPEYPGRPELIEWLQKTYGDRFAHHGGDGIMGTIRGKDLNTLYASAKVVVGDSCFGGRPRYWSDRIPETTGRGGFLIHPAVEGLDHDGVSTYESGDFDGLKKEIEFALANTELRKAWQLRGHEWTKNNATYTIRAKEILEVIFES